MFLYQERGISKIEILASSHQFILQAMACFRKEILFQDATRML